MFFQDGLLKPIECEYKPIECENKWDLHLTYSYLLEIDELNIEVDCTSGMLAKDNDNSNVVFTNFSQNFHNIFL